MSIKIVRSVEWDSAKAVHLMSMPADPFEFDDSTRLWLAWDDDQPIGYATLNVYNDEDGPYGYLKGCGVIPIARGQGVQKRLLRAREAYLRRSGCHTSITDTVHDNPPSMCSLISMGYRPYIPGYEWKEGYAVYWRKSFTKD